MTPRTKVDGWQGIVVTEKYHVYFECGCRVHTKQ